MYRAWTNETSEKYLHSLDNVTEVLKNRVKDVETVLVVLSSAALVFDMAALRQKIRAAYPQSMVFFRSTSGKPIGPIPRQEKVDLLIDFTGPGQRQGWFYARRLRSSAKFAVGRNAGLFRKKIYDRIFDDKGLMPSLPKDVFERERVVQKKVLALAGVPLVPTGETTQDLAKSIALDLPPLSHA